MKKELIFLFIIITLGFIIRVWNLQEIPYGFFCDEAANGYISYSLLTTKRDDHQQLFPFYFESFGDYRMPVTIYSLIPIIALFGLNEFSVRLVNVIYGSLNILIIYFLTKKLLSFINESDNKSFQLFPLFASLIFALSPWHIHFSRTGFEYNAFLFFLTLGFLFFLKAIKKESSFIISNLFFALALYTYHPSLLQTPLFVFFLIFINSNFFLKNKKMFVIFILSFFVFLIPLFIGIKNGKVLTRVNNVSIFEQNDDFPLLKIGASYLEHFSPNFLFLKGDIDFPGHFITRHSVRGIGQIFIWQLPFLILGLFIVLKKRGNLLSLFFLLIIYPLGSIFTPESPTANRSILGIIPFSLLTALGLSYFVGLISKNKLFSQLATSFILLIFIFSTIKYFYLYFEQYPKYSSDYWGWQAGPREIMKYFLTVKDNYDELLLVGNFNAPEIFIKFYDPNNTCQNKCQIGSIEEYNSHQKQLFAVGVDRINELEKNGLKIQTKDQIYYPDGRLAFLIGEIVR